MSGVRLKELLAAGFFSIAMTGLAQAGGFDRGGVNIDQLFDPTPYSFHSGVTYVSPQRKLKNVQRLDSPPSPTALSSSSVDVGGDYLVPYIGFKANLVEPVDCLAAYTQPFGATADYGTGNAYSVTTSEFEIETRDFALTCSYKVPLGKGSFRFIGGVSYGEVEAFQSRQTLLAFGNTGIAVFRLSDEAWSWRAGAAYEIPEIAFRASVMYNARYKYDGLSGTVDTTGFSGGPLGNVTGVYPVSASAEIPQSVEIKVQSGIAPGWLAFGSIKWQEWSKLRSIPINGVISPVTGALSTTTSFDPWYRDGWTVSGGVGHKFSDVLSGAASITWDRGTSTGSGYQTDSWNFGAGVSYTPTGNVEFRLGGSIGVLTSGSSTSAGGDPANAVIYEFGNDVVYAGGASVKIKF